MLEHMGVRWGYVFLRSANHIGPEEFHDLMEQAVEMYLAGEDERRVKHSDYEGRLFTERRYEVIGGLGGQRFDAELETAYGHDSASFLVNEQTGGMGSAISRN
jgi:predicted GTPase